MRMSIEINVVGEELKEIDPTPTCGCGWSGGCSYWPKNGRRKRFSDRNGKEKVDEL
jgi:hypothetical protein